MSKEPTESEIQPTQEKRASKAEIVGASALPQRRPGFRADGTPYPGVSMATGERKSITYEGAKEEFGDAQGVAIYNAIAVAAFGGVPADRRPLALGTLRDENASEGLTEAQLAKRAQRRERVQQILANAVVK